MARILVDQSHCNYHLARYLAASGWQVLFTDAGRVSRGGLGSQGQCLRVFEAGGLHIPDIVAVAKTTLLIVEIDSSFARAQPSIRAYSAHSRTIIHAANAYLELTDPVGELATGFCRTGTVRDIAAYFAKMRASDTTVSMWAGFAVPRTPTLCWVS